MKYMCLKMCVSIFVIAAITGCGKVETKDAKKKPTETSEIHNEYFPYTENCQIKVSGRFYFSDLLEKETTVFVNRERKGKRGEVWHIFFQRVEYDSYDSDGRYHMPKECLDMYYFLVKQDRIYWYRMPHMPDNEMKTFCEEGRIPEEYTHIICQKDEMKDVLSEEESGEHERMLIYGKKKDVRQYNTWTVKKDFSDVLSIYTVSFKKNIGLVAYSCSWTAAGKNTVELWDKRYVSKRAKKSFKYN